MKLLTIHRLSCPSSADFCHGIEGELAVSLPILCDNPECGCDRAFLGLNSRAASTTAMVREIDLDLLDAIEACVGSIEKSGWVVDDCTAAQTWEAAKELMSESAEVAGRYQAGTVLRAWCDQETGEWTYRTATH